MSPKLTIKIVSIFCLVSLVLTAPAYAEEADFEAAPPSTVRKVNVTTGIIKSISKTKEETGFKIKSENSRKVWSIYLKPWSKVFKDGKPWKKYELKTGMRIKVYHTNFKGSSRQIVQKLEVLEPQPEKTG